MGARRPPAPQKHVLVIMVVQNLPNVFPLNPFLSRKTQLYLRTRQRKNVGTVPGLIIFFFKLYIYFT